MPYVEHLKGNPLVSRRGEGKPGHCRICSIEDESFKKLTRYMKGRDGVQPNAREVSDWIEQNIGFRPARDTIYSHRKHMTHPKDRVVSTIRQRQEQGSLPQKVSEDEYLDAVLSKAAQRLVDDPEAVTIDHGLKAASIKQQARQSKQGGLAIFIAAISQPIAAPTWLQIGDGSITGDYTEV